MGTLKVLRAVGEDEALRAVGSGEAEGGWASK